LIANNHDIIYTLSPDGVFTFVSPAWTILLGHNVTDVAGKPFQQFVHPDDLPACSEFLQKVLKTGERMEGIEYRVKHLDGTWHWHTSSAVPLKDSSGDIIGFHGIARDITDRKIAEDKIKSYLAEKELILKEVHHRIKNNMNTIKGLLTLQTMSLNDPSAISALQDTISRVDSMGVLYDKLYRSDNFKEMSLLVYLPSLIDEIVSNFPNSVSVKIEKQIDDFVIELEKLQPLGIIINELLTNTMKYAFTERGNNLISVSATLTGQKVSIIISDNGNGIPESVTFENSTGFGMQLVSMLTEQIGGTIRIERERGTRFVLEFDLH